MHHGSIYIGPWGKCTKSSPTAIKMSKMASNAQVMNMILEIHINYIPFIIHLLYIHSSIRNNDHYHGILQIEWKWSLFAH